MPAQQSVPVRGYEIHAGVTEGIGEDAPIQLAGNLDGKFGVDNQVFGTYLHGIFEQQEACDAILNWAGLTATCTPDFDVIREQGIDRVADMIEEHMDLEKLWPEWSELFDKNGV